MYMHLSYHWTLLWQNNAGVLEDSALTAGIIMPKDVKRWGIWECIPQYFGEMDKQLHYYEQIYFGHIPLTFYGDIFWSYLCKKNRKAGTHYDYIISCKGYVYIVSLDISLAK